MALMLVLAALALLSFLVLLVLTVARNEDRASKASADIIDVRTLADLPAQLVISQLRRATGDLKTDLIWTSQPGMIRRFASGSVDDRGRAGLYDVFKLYSSDHMVMLGADFDATQENKRLADWASTPTLFTDLNDPVPLREVLKSGGGTSTSPTGKTRLVYPILDPGALKSVEGFEVGSDVPGASSVQPMPMPVAWLYVLKDGRVIAPASGSKLTAAFQAGETSETNPIVARIAFWADDESCKINLNTASEPAPWDEPRANSKMDRAYAAYQPAQNEFHRQPGHPAFTALSPVFQSFGIDGTSNNTANAFTPMPDPSGITSTGAFSQNTDSDALRFHDYVESNHRPLPRTPDSVSSVNRDRGSRHGTKPPEEKVSLKNERLFSTIDELLFDTERKPMTVSGDGLSTAQTLTESDVRKARFFLTTHNSAPETNPFNRPKISLWPVQEDPALRTKTDRRMALAASLSGNEFFWQRKSVWKSEGDPGSAQSTSDDASIMRNARIIGYLQDLAGMSMPGYGGSLEAKYGGGGDSGVPSNSDQIITSMFDMLRWGVNIETDDIKAGEPFHYLPPSRASGGDKAVGEYSAVPMIIGSGNAQVRGFGRFPTITEVALVFVATEGEKKNNVYLDEKNQTGGNGADGFVDKTKKFRVFVIVEPFCPVPGSPAATPAFRYRIKGLDKLKITEASPVPNLFTQDFDDKVNRCVSMGASGDRVIEGETGFNGLVSQFLTPDGKPKALGGTDENNSFPFVSEEIAFSHGMKEEEPMTLTAEPITVEILSAFGGADADAVIQTLRIPLPASCKIPVPWLQAKSPEAADIAKRFEANDMRVNLIQVGDVVRSIEADPSLKWGGDLRLLAALGTRGNPPVTYSGDPDAQKDQGRCVFPSPDDLASRFQSPDPKTGEPQRAMHSLRSGAYVDVQYGKAVPGTIANKEDLQLHEETGAPLIPGFRYPAPFTPAVVSMPRGSGLYGGAMNGDNRLGDWNNGPGLIEDGPYIAKPDFGNRFNEEAGEKAGGYFQRGGDFIPDENGVNTAPLRQISSAIAFGSLPTGVFPRDPNGTESYPRPWQTLLFCPNPLSRQTEAGANFDAKDHFGFVQPPDHTWLEFFWMPVMDPWPMSPGFSTMGKVNLNCEIMPFSYIKRTTALRAAMRGVRITAIPSALASADAGDDFYKKPDQVTNKEFRYQVNAKATLNGFDEERFKKGDVFRTSSEICEMFLVPKRIGETDTGDAASGSSEHDYGSAKATAGLTHNKMINWWNGEPGNYSDAFEATGDNTRESPYAQLYPRLCTRSNVFQVHYRVQVIRKSRTIAADTLDLEKDQITADYRGSTVVERYLDPNDKELPDMAASASASQSLDDFYRYRIVSRQPFTP